MTEFEVGDRILLLERDIVSNHVPLGSRGIVESPSSPAGNVGVRWDQHLISGNPIHQWVSPNAISHVNKGDNMSPVLRFDYDVEVESSAIKRLRWDSKQRALLVDFQSGGQGLYENVPVYKWEDLLRSGSKGRYLNQQIKGRYGGRSLDEVTYHRWDEPAPVPKNKFDVGNYVLTADGYTGLVTKVPGPGDFDYRVEVVPATPGLGGKFPYREGELVLWDRNRRHLAFEQARVSDGL